MSDTTTALAIANMKRITPEKCPFTKRMEYAAYFDNEYIGTYTNYSAAENALDAHAYDLIERGLIGDAAMHAGEEEEEPQTALEALRERVVQDTAEDKQISFEAALVALPDVTLKMICLWFANEPTATLDVMLERLARRIWHADYETD